MQHLAEERLQTLWNQFPAVLILGAWQVGKTTLARQCFPDLPYCDLEEPQLRQLFSNDPIFQVECRAQPSLINFPSPQGVTISTHLPGVS